jgi:hypothetical protein
LRSFLVQKWFIITLVLAASVALVSDIVPKSDAPAGPGGPFGAPGDGAAVLAFAGQPAPERVAPPPDQGVPGTRSKQRLTILSANDGDMHLRQNPDGKRGPKKVTADSITVIHLGPDHPPIVKTVYGTVPNTISGPPYMAMTGDGHFGFVTCRKNAGEPEAPDVLSVIDLASPDLKVVQTIKFPDPRMAVMHPDGKRLLVPYDTGIRVYEMRGGQLELVKDNPTDFNLSGIDISPRGDRVVGNGRKTKGGPLTVHLLSYRDGVIAYLDEVKIQKGLPDWDGPLCLPVHPRRPAHHHSQRLAYSQQGRARAGVHRRPGAGTANGDRSRSASRRRHRRSGHSSQRQVRRAKLPGRQPAPGSSSV